MSASRRSLLLRFGGAGFSTWRCRFELVLGTILIVPQEVATAAVWGRVLVKRCFGTGFYLLFSRIDWSS